MGDTKKYMKRISILFVLVLFGVYSPSLANAQVPVTPVDLGEVVSGTPATWTLDISTNDGSALTYGWTIWFESNECGFTITQQPDLSDKNPTTSIELSWTPPEGQLGECSSVLSLYDGMWSQVGIVNLTATVVEESGQETPSVGGLSTFFEERVVKGEIKGRGPSRCAERRINAFRHMLNQTEFLVLEGKLRKASLRLMTARTMLRFSLVGSAVPELEARIDKILESLKEDDRFHRHQSRFGSRHFPRFGKCCGRR